MLKTIKSKFSAVINNNDTRSQKVNKNIIHSFGVKCGSIVISLLLVPVTINYVSNIYYGIWLTISSLVGWMSFLDIGLGNGLRNEVTKAISTHKYNDARIYISTTYAILAIISFCLLIVLSIANTFVNWNKFLNLPSDITENVSYVMLLLAYSFCIQFVVQLIITILNAFHEPAKASLLTLIGQIGVLLGVLIAKTFIAGSLHVLVWILTFIPIAVLFFSSAILFNTKLKLVSPRFDKVNFKYAKNILNSGSSFFVIQIGAIILFQTDNIIITKVLGPEFVTEFNVSYKLFSVVTMIFAIILTPYWSAFTDAYVKEDYTWMRKNIKKMRLVWLCLSSGAILLLFISPFMFKIWVGNTVRINIQFSCFLVIYIIINMWQTIHVYFLNGLGKIRIQLFLVILSGILNIPLSFYLGRLFGLSGVISANTICFFFMSVFFTIQTEKLLNNKATGIWNK